MTDNILLFWAMIVLAGIVANGAWRLAGVVLSRGVKADSDVMVWVKDVSTALVAALIARMILVPSGALAEVPGPLRLIAFGIGILAFFARGSLLMAIAVAEALLFGGHYLWR